MFGEPYLGGEESMSFTHKAGSDSGVDYATVVVFLLWLVMTIGLVVFFVLRSSAAGFS
jgi:preprotein translocase subunit SecG